MTWERRWHPLREEWVTITSHRNTRPWSGADSAVTGGGDESFSPDCYLCPGNTRVSGEVNPEYAGIYVFDNDHPSYSPVAPDAVNPPGDFYRAEPAVGICRVICYSPDHNGSLARMSAAETADLVRVWASETSDLAARDEVASVLIFENKGEVVGVSNNHPHGQIYAPGFVIDGIRREAEVFRKSPSPLMDAIIRAEGDDGRRLVVSGKHTLAFVPYFARFPYEVYVVPRQRRQYLHEMTEDELIDFARVLNEVLIRFDNLWHSDFPYMLLVHQAPCDGDYPDYHFHVQIHPPMRQPGLPKYLASVETGGGHFLNDGSPEQKAAELRDVPAIHFSLQ